MTTTTRLIKHLKRYVAQAMMLTAALCCTACGSVFDDEGDCNPYYFVRFVYDMNMLRADAFATQVSSVDLFVFDAETDEYVRHFSDKGEKLASGSYRMPLENLTPGKYKFIAWCGLADNDEDFTLKQNITRPEDLKCTMARSYDEKGAYSKRNLHALFHGSLSVELPNEEGEHVYTVKLTKDTNNITLSLNHKAGPLSRDRFEVTMTDANGLMAHDNSLLTDEQIEYRPWYLDAGALDVEEAEDPYANDIDEENTQKAGYLKADISTARLMVDRDCRINIVDKERGKVVFSIPFIKWALELRSENYRSMDDQEYLDREFDYNLMVSLDDNSEGWTATEIIINGWHLLTQDAVIE